MELVFFILFYMPQAGFEPVHGYPYNDLNVARLPIPPLGQLLYLKIQQMRPRGVEPRSREPESHVRSITLRAHNYLLFTTEIMLHDLAIKSKYKIKIKSND